MKNQGSAVGMLGLLLLIVAGCSSDGDDVLEPPATTDFDLHYDGNNKTAPLLPAKTFEAAARFTTALTAPLADGELTEVRFFIAGVPASCTVKVYGANTVAEPGPVLYSADVNAAPASWNTHVLTPPVPIPDGDLWISIRFTNAVSQQTIGCDPGPGKPDGDWLFDGNVWTSFIEYAHGESINWNIRGIVAVPS